MWSHNYGAQVDNIKRKCDIEHIVKLLCVPIWGSGPIRIVYMYGLVW